jgi:hypothetical protein
MGDLSGNGQITRLVRLVRYLLSPPRFDAQSTPAVLVVAPDLGFRRVRLFASLAVIFLAAVLIFGAFRSGSMGETIDAALAFLAAVALVAVLTLLPKRLIATFGERDVSVSEGGIRAPRASWTMPIASFSGLAWRRHDLIERNESFEMPEKTTVRRRAIPLVTEFHWIELVHPDPAKTLVLSLHKSDARIAGRLKAYSQRLNLPILAGQTGEGI